MGDLDSVSRVVRDLLVRPKWNWSKEHRDDLRGERALPLLCLIGDPQRTDAAAEVLAARLTPDPAAFDEAPARLIPSASVDAGQVIVDDEQGHPLLPLLNHLVQHLGSDRYGAGREIPFHTFRLVDWLTRHTASTLRRDQQAPLRSKLLEWYAPTPQEGEKAEQIVPIVEAVVPDKALALSKAMPQLLTRFGRWLWLIGLRGGEPRWMMRQRFAGTQHSASFLRFARRLTVDNREHENVDQIKLLLVHAFLRDLRLFYGTRTWRLRRWRRTAYVAVVLRGITESNGGWELLRLINDVRNHTGEHDPLLVVATAADIPAGLDLTPAPASAIDDAVAAWKRELPWKRQQLQPTARFLAVRLDGPPAHAPAGPIRPGVGEQWAPRRVPLFARNGTVVLAALSLVIALATSVTVAWSTAEPDRCGVEGFPMAAAVWLPGRNAECIGYSADGYTFGSTDKLRKAQEAIFEQNREALRLHDANRSRPVISLVYFAELTHPSRVEGTDDAVAEELTGLLIRQSQHNKIGNFADDRLKPLLRIVVVNGGYEMGHALRAVDEFVLPLAERDPTLMGVVGGGRTVDETEKAIFSLGAHGIPMLATNLTGDALPERSPLYFQLVPGNRKQARLIIDYAASTGRSVTVYHPDLTKERADGYLRSLHDQFEVLRKSGPVPVRFTPWNSDPDGFEVTCRRDDIAFYAGRETGFGDFLETVLHSCQDDATPTVIGDDTITRYIAQGESFHSDTLLGASLSYVSLANRIVLAGKSCVEHGKPAAGGEGEEGEKLDIFCAGLHHLYAPESGRGAAWKEFGRELREHDGDKRWTGERVGVAYDAAEFYLVAAINNRRRNNTMTDVEFNRGAVAQEFHELDCSDPKRTDCFIGATGLINVHEHRDGSNRPLAILTFSDITRTDENPTCTHRDIVPCPADR